MTSFSKEGNYVNSLTHNNLHLLNFMKISKHLI